MSTPTRIRHWGVAVASVTAVACAASPRSDVAARAGGGQGVAPATASTTADATAARAEDLAAFDQVWTTIRDQHWDPALGGLDWDAIRAELRPRVEQAQSAAQSRAVLKELLQRLGQSHFAIVSADAVELLQPDAADTGDPLDAAPGGEGTCGLQARAAGDTVLVTAVDESSAAWKAGIRPGWMLLRVGRTDMPELLRRLHATAGDGVDARFHLALALQQRLQGPVGGRLQLTLLDGVGASVQHDLRLAAPAGELVTFGNLPPARVWLTSRWARPPQADGSGGVGVIAFNAFLDPVRVMRQFAAAMDSFQRADGVVLDLRGNPGGIGAMAMGMAGFFVAEKDRYLGTMITRQTRLRFVVNPRPRVYAGPLAVLVDDMTASTGEILAAGLRDLGRARVFGRRTAGMALPSLLTVLPNGDGFQYAFASYETAAGAVLEGAGVTPDELVPLQRETLLSAADATLASALDWLAGQTAGGH